VQLAVMDRGPLLSCVNPSGALVGRIRDAKRGVLTGRYGGAPPQMPSAPMLPVLPPNPEATRSATFISLTDIDKFIAENQLDQSAVTSLRAEAPEVQAKVLAMGPLVNALNPSAALMGRIRSAKIGVQTYFGGKGGPPVVSNATSSA